MDLESLPLGLIFRNTSATQYSSICIDDTPEKTPPSDALRMYE